MFNRMQRRLCVLLTVGVVLLLPRAAEAGPPLLCHPFDAGSSPVLPWGRGEGWNVMDRSYNVQRLTADTLRLLSANAPILARMENLRRATIYASQNERVARELLTAVLARVNATTAGPEHRLALFDAGYLIEAYRQASDVYRWNMLSPAERSSWAIRHEPEGLDGYALLKKALEAGSNAEMEFAASLMKEGPVSTEHRRKAEAGATPESLLARNLRMFAARR
jgi:hypothetical protein